VSYISLISCISCISLNLSFVFHYSTFSTYVTFYYTLRGFFGFGPLCGTGVTSLIELMTIPLEINPLIPDSRPDPTPFTTTDTSRIPITDALPPRISPTFAAANGVPFFAPLKPIAPDDDVASTFPFTSVKTIFVLLYVDSTCKIPVSTFFLETAETWPDFPSDPDAPSVFTIRFFPIYIRCYFLSALFRPVPAVCRTFPRRVREFVFVLCPRDGSPR